MNVFIYISSFNIFQIYFSISSRLKLVVDWHFLRFVLWLLYTLQHLLHFFSEGIKFNIQKTRHLSLTPYELPIYIVILLEFFTYISLQHVSATLHCKRWCNWNILFDSFQVSRIFQIPKNFTWHNLKDHYKK